MVEVLAHTGFLANILSLGPILINLLTNAARYTEPEELIRLEADRAVEAVMHPCSPESYGLL